MNAGICFRKKEYKDCLEIISKHTFKIPMMIKDMKVMKLQASYELGYYDLIYHEIDAYRHFLSNTSGIAKEFIENDKKFLKYLYRLTRIKENFSQRDLENLDNELRNLNSSNILINWIAQKIKEIKT